MLDFDPVVVKKAIKRSLLILGLGFILFLAYSSWDVLQPNIQRAETGFLTGSIVFAVIGLFLNGLYFQSLLLKYGCELDALEGVKVFVTSHAAKYIPGKIWGLAFQITHLTQNQQPVNKVSMAVVLANVEFSLGLMVCTFFVAMAALAWMVSPVLSLCALACGTVLFVFLSRNFLVDDLIQGFATRFLGLKVEPASRRPSTVRRSTGLFLGQSAFYLISLIFAVFSFYDLSFEDVLVIITIHSFSVIASALVFVVPSGVGVREALFLALTKLMPVELSFEELVALAVLMRALQILIEACAIALVPLLGGKK